MEVPTIETTFPMLTVGDEFFIYRNGVKIRCQKIANHRFHILSEEHKDLRFAIFAHTPVYKIMTASRPERST